VRLAPPPGTPPHDEPVPFLLAMRARDWAWWRPLLGLLLFTVAYVAAAVVVVAAGPADRGRARTCSCSTWSTPPCCWSPTCR
jgi:hypothetical protein